MEKKKLVRTINTRTAEGQEQALAALTKQIAQPAMTEEEKKARDVKRLNMDIPTDLYELIEAEIDETGQTVKGFFVMLAKQHFRGQGKL